MDEDYVVYLGSKSVQCRYHLTGEKYEMTHKNITFSKPCNGIMCWKHSPIRRSYYARMLERVMPQYEHQWFITLPIGSLIHQKLFTKLWGSFRRAWVRDYPRLEYFFMKEIQDNFSHIHGIVLSNDHEDISRTPKIWAKFLEKHCGIKRMPDDEQVQRVFNERAAAKYVCKDVENPLGVQMPPKGWAKRLIMRSEGIWDAPKSPEHV